MDFARFEYINNFVYRASREICKETQRRYLSNTHLSFVICLQTNVQSDFIGIGRI